MSPAPSANESDEPIQFQPPARTFRSTALSEVTQRALSVGWEPLDEDETADVEIEMMFRRKLMGLLALPRQQRSQARRAILEWRRTALKALREKRAGDRRARFMLRQQQRPAPRQ